MDHHFGRRTKTIQQTELKLYTFSWDSSQITSKSELQLIILNTTDRTETCSWITNHTRTPRNVTRSPINRSTGDRNALLLWGNVTVWFTTQTQRSDWSRNRITKRLIGQRTSFESCEQFIVWQTSALNIDVKINTHTKSWLVYNPNKIIINFILFCSTTERNLTPVSTSDPF